jgi:hypothetical protein
MEVARLALQTMISLERSIHSARLSYDQYLPPKSSFLGILEKSNPRAEILFIHSFIHLLIIGHTGV